ncbi:MAG: rhodanese-like domain-containing protein [Alkalispirochaeta sp.]
MQFTWMWFAKVERVAAAMLMLAGPLATAAAGGSGESLENRLDRLYRDIPQVVQPEEVRQMITEGTIPEDVYLLDVRSREEWDVSRLPEAELVAFDGFDLAQIDHIPRDARIILYCAVGRRSGSVGEELRSAGYTDVWDMYGGILLWAERDLPLIDAKGPTRRVHGRRRWYGGQITNSAVEVVY